MRKPFNGSYKLTQEWGVNPDVYARFGLKGHNGLDYGLPNSTELVAPHSGKVLESAFDAAGYGNYIKIESISEGSVLAHLQKAVVSVGQEVNEGQVVGYSDNTGFSTGPHLHWGYYKIPRNRNDGYLGFINQLPLLVQIPTMDRRPYWFDLMNKVIWNKPHEEITDQMVNDWIKDYPTQRNRSGLWDKLAIKAGYTGNTNILSVDDLYNLVLASGAEAFATRIKELETKLAEEKALRQQQKATLIAKTIEFWKTL